MRAQKAAGFVVNPMTTAWRSLQQARGREASSVDLTEARKTVQATGSQAKDDGKQGKSMGLANTRINR